MSSYLFSAYRCVCAAGEFQCPGDQCVPVDTVCDGHRDCPSGTDEAICPSRGNSTNAVLFDSHKCNTFFCVGWNPFCVLQ